MLKKELKLLLILAFVFGLAGIFQADGLAATKLVDEGITKSLVIPVDPTVAQSTPKQDLDQESPYTNAGYNADSSSLTWQQEVTVGIAGQLTGVEIYVLDTGNADFFINIGAPWQSDTHDFETVIRCEEEGWFFIDISSANINLNVDDKFVIGIHGRDEGLGLGGNAIPGLYERGELWLNEHIHGAGDEWDLGFRTYMLPLQESNLTISPPSGDYVTTQGFDLALIVEAPGLSVVGGSATLDGSDVTPALASCIIPGTLVSGGQTFRCPGLAGGIFGAGTHTLSVTLDLSDGSSVSDTVTWEVKENTEP